MSENTVAIPIWSLIQTCHNYFSSLFYRCLISHWSEYIVLSLTNISKKVWSYLKNRKLSDYYTYNIISKSVIRSPTVYIIALIIQFPLLLWKISCCIVGDHFSPLLTKKVFFSQISLTLTVFHEFILFFTIHRNFVCARHKFAASAALQLKH